LGDTERAPVRLPSKNARHPDAARPLALSSRIEGPSDDRHPKYNNSRSAALSRLASTGSAGRRSILKNPTRAADQILAAPTVVRRFPTPIRVLVGDLSDSDRLLIGLELPQSGSQPR
jgi:circadian clock protein KaiB